MGFQITYTHRAFTPKSPFMHEGQNTKTKLEKPYLSVLKLG